MLGRRVDGVADRIAVGIRARQRARGARVAVGAAVVDRERRGVARRRGVDDRQRDRDRVARRRPVGGVGDDRERVGPGRGVGVGGVLQLGRGAGDRAERSLGRQGQHLEGLDREVGAGHGDRPRAALVDAGDRVDAAAAGRASAIGCGGPNGVATAPRAGAVPRTRQTTNDQAINPRSTRGTESFPMSRRRRRRRGADATAARCLGGPVQLTGGLGRVLRGGGRRRRGERLGPEDPGELGAQRRRRVDAEVMARACSVRGPAEVCTSSTTSASPVWLPKTCLSSSMIEAGSRAASRTSVSASGPLGHDGRGGARRPRPPRSLGWNELARLDLDRQPAVVVADAAAHGDDLVDLRDVLVLGELVAEEDELDRALEVVEGREHHHVARARLELARRGDDAADGDPLAVLDLRQLAQRPVDGRPAAPRGPP